MIIKKHDGPGRPPVLETTDNHTVAFLIEKVFDVESCGSCSFWCGRCQKDVRYRIAADTPCNEFVPRNEATFNCSLEGV
ncbi:hypothetical protein MUO79_02785 [Candidatus Bathyarchaeota archaeon]|nr:hypothetical protein [Candidatus Bathyarchaeota archaeon]